ncbi:Serine/threonine-protein kinase StkP [Novipirellula aureliae]|uniref:non-specific serine/threonine protein kinase n=2 Tax=Novipirellula aureliae TaxID=2527966 RepID=A0A5C6EBR0_9BACT|nr:Serine/threonine-protein kinase StkP [Novipirellula aureliae]
MLHGQRNQYQTGQEIVPGYTLVRPLGSGMAGSVWIARAAGGTHVALKIVPLEKVGGRKELSALRTLRNVRQPNLCPVHGFWTKDSEGRLLAEGETEAINPDSSLFFPSPAQRTPATHPPAQPSPSPPSQQPPSGTMAIGSQGEFRPPEAKETVTPFGGDQPKAEELIVVMGLGDCTLYDRLQQVRVEAGIPVGTNDISYGLDAAETIRYLRASARAIDLLNQEHSIYHCDIKPQNILLVGGEAQVCDFGLAHKFEGDMRTTRQAFASPAYAAPEVLQGRTYSRSVDQYSLAITYFELRTGLLPFDMTTEANIALAKCTGKLELNQLASPERKVLRRAMEVDPMKRFPSCTDFIDALAIANGVDRRGGITPLKLLVATILLAASTGGGLWAWRTLDRRSYDSFFGFDGGQIAKDRFEKAKYAFEQFKGFQASNESDKFILHLDPLRKVIEESQSALPSTLSDPELKQSIETLASNACDDWLNGILDQVAFGGLGDKNQYIQDDLQRLEATYQDGPERIIDRATEKGLSFKTKLLAAKLQFAVLENLAVDEPIADQIRSSLRDQPDTFADEKQFATAATALALTHFVPNAKPGHYTEDPALNDIASAQEAINQSDKDSLPAWCLNRWKQMSEKFFPDLTTAYDTDNEKRLVIGKTWPNIYSDAELSNLKTLASQKNWKELETAYNKFPKQDEFDEATRNKLAIFDLMIQNLNRPDDADRFFSELSQKLDRSNDDFFKQPMEALLDEMIGQRLRKPIPASIEEAIVFCQASQLLVDASRAKRPPALDTLLLLASVANGPKSFRHPDLFRVLEQDASEPLNINAFFKSAIKLEDATLQDRSLSRSEIASIKRSFQADLHPYESLVSNHYQNYLKGLLGEQDDDARQAANAWKSISEGDPSAIVREQLGSTRCIWIASTLLSYATKSSGVADDDVIKRRFVSGFAGAEYIEPAQWWLEGDNSDSGTIRAELRLQKLLKNIAEFSVQNKSLNDASIKAQLVPFKDRLESSIATGKAVSSDAQLYRAAFEYALDLNEAASTSTRGQSVSLLLRSGVAALDVGIAGSNSYDRDLVSQILTPLMKQVQRLIMRSKSDRSDWDIPSIVNKEVLQKFCLHALNANVYFKDEDPEYPFKEKLRCLEMCAAIAASDLGKSPDERTKYWLLAAEFARELHESSRKVYDHETLDLLEAYLSKATQTWPDSPEIAIQLAFLHYHRANLRSGTLSSNSELKNAADELSTAIEKLEARNDYRELLYDAYWRHANILISAAFLGPTDTRKETLLVARSSAINACEMLEKEIVDVENGNAAYLSLGNACEDLAFYCNLPEKEQMRYYEQAVDAFTNAVARTGVIDPMKASFYLARCKYRYYQHGGPKDSLDDYNETFLEFQDDAAPDVQVEWLGWRAKYRKENGDVRGAAVDLKRAYEILMDHSDSISDQTRNEIVIEYASMLNSDDAEIGNRSLAIQLLDEDLRDPEGLSYWKNLELRCQLLAGLAVSASESQQTKYYSDLVDQASNVSTVRFDEVRQNPEEAALLIANISLYVRKAGFAQRYGGDPIVDRDKAWKCLQDLESNVKQKVESIPRAKAYIAFLSANAKSLSQESLGSRVNQYLQVFDATQDVGLDTQFLHQMRLVVLNQFHPLFFAVQGRKSEVMQIVRSSKSEIDSDKLGQQIELLERSRELSRVDEDDIRYVKQIYL